MKIFRDRVNACDPPEGPTDQQYEDIILQALPSEYDRIRQTQLERRDFGLADICRMMVAIYTDNLSRSESSKGIAGRHAAIQAVDLDRTSVVPGMSLLRTIWAFQKKIPTPNQTPAATAAAASSASSATTHGQYQQKPRGRRQNNGGGGGGRVWYSYHKATSHNDTSCRVQQHKAGGHAHVAAARTQRVKGVCSAYDLAQEDDKPERPYISFTATEVQSKTEPATEPRQENGTWPFGPLTRARPWPCVEREKPAVLLGRQDEPDPSYVYGETDSEGEPLYGTALMASGPAAFEHKPSAGEDSVTVLVDNGTSGHYFDDLIIPNLKHRLLNYVLLTTPRKIRTAEGAMLDGTA